MFDKLAAFLNSQKEKQTALFDGLRKEKIRFLEIVLQNYLHYFHSAIRPASSKWSESISEYKNEIQLKDVRIPIIDFDKPLEKQLNGFWIGIFQDENMQVNVFKELLSEDFKFTPDIYKPIAYLQILLIYYAYLVPEIPNKVVSRIDFITTEVVAYALSTWAGIEIGAKHAFRTKKTSITRKAQKDEWAKAILSEYDEIKSLKTRLSKRSFAENIRKRMETKMEKAPSIDTILRRLKENKLI